MRLVSARSPTGSVRLVSARSPTGSVRLVRHGSPVRLALVWLVLATALVPTGVHAQAAIKPQEPVAMRIIGSGALACVVPVEAHLSYPAVGGSRDEPRPAGGRIGFVLGAATGFVVGGIIGGLIESLFAKEGADTVGLTGAATGAMAGAIGGGMLGRDIGERLAAPDSAESARDADARPLLLTPARHAVPVAARFACGP